MRIDTLANNIYPPVAPHLERLKCQAASWSDFFQPSTFVVINGRGYYAGNDLRLFDAGDYNTDGFVDLLFFTPGRHAVFTMMDGKTHKTVETPFRQAG